MDHRLDMLLVNNGQLLQRSPTNVERLVPYMATEEVEILSKGDPKPVAKPAGYWEYPFELNTNPDPIWRELFLRNIPLNRDAAPVFRIRQMVLVCDPVNLERFYQYIRPAIDKTNADYRRERDLVTTRVQEEQRRRAEETKAAGDRADVIRQKFDDLKL